MSRVDVIVPCYNYGHFLHDCVGSALAQPGVDVRVLIIDDCSNDDSAAAGERLARQDRRVEFRRHTRNRGHIATYNEGLRWASGDYTLLLSADDMLAPGALARAAEIMDARPEVGLAIGREIKTANPDPAGYVAPAVNAFRLLSGAEFVEWCCRACVNPVSTPSAIVRTAVQHRVGGYRPELPHSGDLEMWLRLAGVGSVAVLEAEQAYYRTHSTNMSIGYRGIPDLLQLRAAYYSFFASCRRRRRDGGRLWRITRRNLAFEFFWLAYRLFDLGDAEGCAASLGHALTTYPPIRYSPDWSRLSCKRLMGAGVWECVRPLVRGLRRRARAVPA
jgi:glycosyltransferase involved in cell wall biosynthesis